MSQQEGFLSAGGDHFEEAAAWHTRWRDASEAGLSPEEVDRWAEWSKVAGEQGGLRRGGVCRRLVALVEAAAVTDCRGTRRG